MRERATWPGSCRSELTGTFILVFFGVGSVHAAVLTGAQQGLWQVAVVWGIAIPGPRGGFLTVYILSPLVGALLGGALYQGLAALAHSVREQRIGDQTLILKSEGPAS